MITALLIALYVLAVLVSAGWASRKSSYVTTVRLLAYLHHNGYLSREDLAKLDTEVRGR